MYIDVQYIDFRSPASLIRSACSRPYIRKRSPLRTDLGLAHVSSVAATRPKVDLKLEVGHMLVESHSNFLMGQLVDFGSQPDLGR